MPEPAWAPSHSFPLPALPPYCQMFWWENLWSMEKRIPIKYAYTNDPGLGAMHCMQRVWVLFPVPSNAQSISPTVVVFASDSSAVIPSTTCDFRPHWSQVYVNIITEKKEYEVREITGVKALAWHKGSSGLISSITHGSPEHYQEWSLSTGRYEHKTRFQSKVAGRNLRNNKGNSQARDRLKEVIWGKLGSPRTTSSKWHSWWFTIPDSGGQT